MRLVALILACCAANPVAAEVGRWQVDYAASRLGFTAEQAGAKFQGEFKSFEADVRFDPNALAESSATVFVDTKSVDTSNDERDGVLRGKGWFEVDAFPRAKFTAHDFVKTDAGFTARGELSILSASVPVTFRFAVKETDGRIELTGSAELDRLAFGLGLGEWADPKWIGRNVEVNVTLSATR